MRVLDRVRYALPGVAMKLLVAFVLLFLLTPLVIVVSVSVTPEQFLNFPPSGVSFEWYREIFASPEWMTAMQNSLAVAVGAMCVGSSIGGTLAYTLDRYEYRAAALLGGLGLVPILFPPIIVGVAFLAFFLTVGFSGTIWNLMIAHGIFFSPFAYLLVTQGLDEVNRSYEEASKNLGATPLRTFIDVTLPLISTNVLAGAIFIFVMSLNEYVIAWLLSGFIIPTVPIKIFTSLRYSYSPDIAAVSVIMVLVTVVIITLVDYMAGGVWE